MLNANNVPLPGESGSSEWSKRASNQKKNEKEEENNDVKRNQRIEAMTFFLLWLKMMLLLYGQIVLLLEKHPVFWDISCLIVDRNYEMKSSVLSFSFASHSFCSVHCWIEFGKEK